MVERSHHPCVICGNTKYTHPESVYHGFPRETERCNLWKTIIAMWKAVISIPQCADMSVRKLCRHYKICSRHFSPRNYMTGQISYKLKRDAYPDQNLQITSASSLRTVFVVEGSSYSGIEYQSQPLSDLSHAECAQIVDPEFGSLDVDSLRNLVDQTSPMKKEIIENIELPERKIPPERGQSSPHNKCKTLLDSAQDDGADTQLHSSETMETDFNEYTITPSSFASPVSFSSQSKSRKTTRKSRKGKKTKSCLGQTRRNKRKQLKKSANFETSINEDSISPNIIKIASEYLSGTFLEYIKSQTMSSGKHETGGTSSLSHKLFGLSLYFKSPPVYEFLSKILDLPSPKRLKQWLHNESFSSEWNEHVISEVMKRKVNSMNEVQMLCGIVFDVLAFESSGERSHKYTDTDHGNRDESALYVIIFVAKGLCSNWKQTLDYYCYQESLSANSLKIMIMDCIVKLKDWGLKPKFVTCGQNPSNRSCFEELSACLEEPFIPLDDEKVFLFYDTQHLMRSTRNSLAIGDIKIDSKIISWKYLRDFYDLDRHMDIRLAPKITKNHINFTDSQKVKDNLATQLFSKSVATGIYTHSALGRLPPEAVATATFVYKMDELFDVFNSQHINHSCSRKSAISNKNDNIPFLKVTQDWIKSWEIDTDDDVPSMEGWLHNINALISLWEDLHSNYNIDHLLTNNLKQDCLNNFSCLNTVELNSEVTDFGVFISNVQNVATKQLLHQCVTPGTYRDETMLRSEQDCTNVNQSKNS